VNVQRDSARSIGIGQGVAIVATPSRSAADLESRYVVKRAADMIGVNVRVITEKVALTAIPPHNRVCGRSFNFFRETIKMDNILNNSLISILLESLFLFLFHLQPVLADKPSTPGFKVISHQREI
jgi:hypothetical protein